MNSLQSCVAADGPGQSRCRGLPRRAHKVPSLSDDCEGRMPSRLQRVSTALSCRHKQQSAHEISMCWGGGTSHRWPGRGSGALSSAERRAAVFGGADSAIPMQRRAQKQHSPVGARVSLPRIEAGLPAGDEPDLCCRRRAIPALEPCWRESIKGEERRG